jgi:hypothetical protein
MQMDYALQHAASDGVFNKRMDEHIGELGKRASALAATLNPATEAVKDAAAKKKEKTGLELIADAYEKWLSSDNGLKALLGNISEFVKSTAATDPNAAKAMVGKTIGDNTIDRPRAIVEVDDLVIDLAPPETKSAGAMSGVMKSLTDHSPEEFLQAIAELFHEMDERGMKFPEGSPIHLA